MEVAQIRFFLMGQSKDWNWAIQTAIKNVGFWSRMGKKTGFG